MVKINDSILVEIQNFSEKLKQKFQLKHLFVYGSYADGSYDEWSDIDIAVILEGPESHSREIYSIGKECDIRFDALGFSFNDFDKSLLPIIPEIKQNGLQII